MADRANAVSAAGLHHQQQSVVHSSTQSYTVSLPSADSQPRYRRQMRLSTILIFSAAAQVFAAQVFEAQEQLLPIMFFPNPGGSPIRFIAQSPALRAEFRQDG